ncbi:polysaccharide pyruvyl transferase family protein [Clostridium perfringens]|uniref:polysaccharide pyruvyl transferase family protein n=1 Tax=Clostridium perfringens TaxID=1502 RepID=UPI0021AD159C|nr:polysaccharide pyruvyl transferase family protein [Clostridium perfringens]
MNRICVFDTSIATLNIGDEIIMDSVNKELNDIFNEKMLLKVPSHEKIGRISHIRLKMSDNIFVGGTNLLTSDMFKLNPQWNISLKDILVLKDVVLLGVGWRKYSEKTNFYTKFLLNKVLSKKYIHAVRDEFTKSKLMELGFKNVINTGCPTLWKLDEKHCSQIKTSKSENVICTFTDYDKDLVNDKKLADLLFKNYKNVYCWVQGAGDLEYIKSISENFIIVSPQLAKYDELLQSDIDLEFVGTRLHAGIRAMQKGRRSIIISIDNRAREMGKDFNLNVLERDEIEKLENIIYSDFETKITLNWEEINKWKKQFN